MTRKQTRLVSLIAGVMLLLVGSALYNYGQVQAARQLLAEVVQKSSDEMTMHLYNISTTLQKSVYANSPEQISGVSAKLWRDSSLAKSCLSDLPTEGYDVDGLYKFLSQVGDYTMALARRTAEGEELTEEDRNVLLQMCEYSEQIAASFVELQRDIIESGLTFSQINEAFSADSYDGSTPDIGTGLKDIADGFANYPTLIYDGPFSDHLLVRESTFLKDKAPVTRESARAALAALLKLSANSFFDAGDEDSLMPCYTFRAGDAVYSVTKNGGYLALMLQSTPQLEQMQLSLDDAVAVAQEFVQTLGLGAFAESYYETKNGITTVNFAYETNDVLCYTDLVKVSVERGGGAIVGVDARNFLMNHRERTFPKPKIDIQKAMGNLSPLLTPQDYRLALIPTEGKNEKFCYEVKCEGQGGETVMVYLSADRGREEQILILIMAEDGVLVI